MAFDSAPGPRQIIADIVVSLLTAFDASGDFSVDEDLRSLGLKSFDFVTLLLAIEEAFHLAIPPRLMTTKNFSSVAAIERMVESLTGLARG